MPNKHIDVLLNKLQKLQREVEDEVEAVLAEKRAEFRYDLERGKVHFEEDIRRLHERYREGLWRYIRSARPAHILSAPIIYSVIFPLLFLDLMVSFYQHTCFRIYGIPLVRRRDYIVIDRHRLGYLNAIEKLNCVYCGYGNGLAEYVREIIARTEQYWCPIKHARRVKASHARVNEFSDYGDAEHYHQRLKELRDALRHPE